MSDPEQTMTRIKRHVLGHPAIVLDKGSIVARAGDGTFETLGRAQALTVLADGPCLVCHKTFLLERLGGPGHDKALMAKASAMRHFDICELFAFVTPALAATPTPYGLARTLGIGGGENALTDLTNVFKELAKRIADPAYPNRPEAARLAGFLARTNWPFAELVETALFEGGTRKPSDEFSRGLNVWDQLDEWQDDGPRPPASQHGLEADEVTTYLTQILGPDAEHRAAQFDYAQTTAAAFQPREAASANHIALAEAGTGLGKTLGYLAPAALWAQKNAATVWISTYTKNLQRQLEQESRCLYPDPEERHRKVVIRKGRENYACLLNMQETFGRLTATNAASALMAALIARWARYSRDGDMIGGDFPAWLMSLFFPERVRDGRQITPYALGLTDRRGECIYAVCPHYKKCFIEKNQRAARKAELVIANHALVMHQAALDQALGAQKPPSDDNEDDEAPSGLRRLVFDEGHHVFDAADNAFSAHITGLETAELRRWVRGAETRNRRARSLMDRLGELIDDDPEAQDFLTEVEQAARHLPGPGWQARMEAGMPEGPAEGFLSSVRAQVHARADARAFGNLESDCRPVIDGLGEAARELSELLVRLREPMIALARMLSARLDTEASDLDTTTRIRIEALARSLNRRARLMITAWVDMLARLKGDDDPAFVEWFAIDMLFGREFDVGMHAHWVDPSEPLAATVLTPSDGVVITSATLRDRPPEAPDDWEHAEMRTGAIHLPYSVHRASFASPFDYPKNSRILVVTDVGRENMDHLAAAYRELFLASGGGALGLFTAISRLKAVFGRLAEPMADNGLTLFAQHVDPIDTGTLVDMFRAQKNACLLGTDAVRDGVDVAGNALRLIVQDRVPWPQPTILERARRKAFGGAAWQDMAVRLRLRQAYGRLIRRKTDRGVFVLLDNRLASRFTTAFPDGVEVERMGLVEAIDAVADFTNG